MGRTSKEDDQEIGPVAPRHMVVSTYRDANRQIVTSEIVCPGSFLPLIGRSCGECDEEFSISRAGRPRGTSEGEKDGRLTGSTPL